MFIAYVMFPGNDIDEIREFDVEAEAHRFGRKQSTYVIDPHGQYDPPLVFLLEADDLATADRNKFTRPVAIYQRGSRFDTIREETD